MTSRQITGELPLVSVPYRCQVYRGTSKCLSFIGTNFHSFSYRRKCTFRKAVIGLHAAYLISIPLHPLSFGLIFALVVGQLVPLLFLFISRCQFTLYCEIINEMFYSSSPSRSYHITFFEIQK